MASAWVDILQRTGSINQVQSEDDEVRKGVRLPFFILSGLFLIWPILYYFRDSYAQTPVQLAPLPPLSTVKEKKGPTPTAAPTPTPDPVTRPDAVGRSVPSSPSGPAMAPQGDVPKGPSGQGLPPPKLN